MMEKKMNLTISFRDGTSYDDTTKYASQEREIVTLSVRSAGDLLKLMTGDMSDSTQSNPMIDPYSMIMEFGYTDTCFNFECCSGYDHNHGDDYNLDPANTNFHFVDPQTSSTVMNLIDFVLTQGSTVLFADFSLKALISHWKIDRWGECPFKNVDTIEGPVVVGFPIEATKSSMFNQLANIACMSVPEALDVGRIVVDAMYRTIVYEVNDMTDPNINTYTHSVMTGHRMARCCDDESDEISEYVNRGKKYRPETCDLKLERYCKKTLAYGSNDLWGLPVHTVVTFGNRKGMMIVSNIHFKELVNINTTIEKIVSMTERVFGHEYSLGVEKTLSGLDESSEIFRAMSAEYVSAIANGSSPVV